MPPSTVVVDKIAWLLEESKSVAAHHGLCMSSARVPSGTWSIPTPLTAFEMFEGQAVVWESGKQRGVLVSRSLHGEDLLKPMSLPLAPVTDG